MLHLTQNAAYSECDVHMISTSCLLTEILRFNRLSTSWFGLIQHFEPKKCNKLRYFGISNSDALPCAPYLHVELEKFASCFKNNELFDIADVAYLQPHLPTDKNNKY